MTSSLVILLGPTGVGRTGLGLRVAERFGSSIISSDSRQLYKGLSTGTAVPTPEQMVRVKHYMINTLPPTDYYSTSNFGRDVIFLPSELHKTIPAVIMTGGSVVYIDTMCKDINDISAVTSEVRDALYVQFEIEGLAPALAELKETDPIRYEEVDWNNCKRVIHAVEICRMVSESYSSFRTNVKERRPFRIIKVGLNRDRDELYGHVNRRVGRAISERLLEEVRRACPFHHSDSLNMVGCRKLFNYFGGRWTLDLAMEEIKRNSRAYARKQVTWFRWDPEITWFHPDETEAILTHLSQQII